MSAAVRPSKIPAISLRATARCKETAASSYCKYKLELAGIFGQEARPLSVEEAIRVNGAKDIGR